ncbi:MAG: hypothetical protein WEF50_00810 [Myxococcota bacterium]
MRKRGWGAGRWFGRGGGGSRGLDKLRDLRGLALRDVRELENLDELPEEMSAGAARWEGNRPIALLTSRRDGLDLLGWARLCARRAGGERGLREMMIAAPSFSARTRQAAARAAESGPSVHLVALPALAEDREIYELESHPAAPKPSLIGGSTNLLGRLLRVLEGAAAVSGAGGIRPAGADYLLYMRGERAARISLAGDEVAIAIALPERRDLRVHDASFASVAAELHDWIVRLARDTRLLDGAAARRDALVERCADEAHAGVTARWLPWNDDGNDPIDWVGIDIGGRPVVGAIRSTLGSADVPALIAGWHLLDLEREIWTPGAVGFPRIFVSADGIGTEAREILESLAGPIGAGTVPAEPARELPSVSVEEEPGERDEVGGGLDAEARAEGRGRRRGRRRRRGGEREFGDRDAAPMDAATAEEERNARRAARRAAEAERGSFEPESEARAEDEPSEAPEAEFEREAETGEARTSEEFARGRRGRRGRRRRGGRREIGGSTADGSALESSGDAGGEGETVHDADEGREGEFEEREVAVRAEGEPELAAASGEDEQLSSELEATLAESEEETERGGPAAEPVEVSPPRMRRQRAAILVRDDPDSILAGLVLARDRRTIVSFRVAPQEGLMDFFKGPATDIADNVDVLVVGFSAQPRPKEVLDTVELFRGRLQWFDHHEWAIEDLVRLRAALGRDSIVIEEDASSPLGAVTEVTERRSRFTDKLVDLSARRLSEADMQKWGNRVIALIKRMAATPGEHRAEIMPVLSGKPTDLPSAPDVYRAETSWVEENDPRIVHFGEYQLAVARVPSGLDAGEVGRRLRLRTGARLSLATREGDEIVVLSCNDEKRPLNVSGLLDAVGSQQPWVMPKSGGDRIGRARVEGLPEHPERMEALIGEIVRHRSVLYG